MTRDEATQMLDCSLSDLADLLGISTAAVAKWSKDKIPALREYQIKELAAVKAKADSSKVDEPNVIQSAYEKK